MVLEEHGITQVIRSYPPGNMTACTRFLGDPSRQTLRYYSGRPTNRLTLASIFRADTETVNTAGISSIALCFCDLSTLVIQWFLCEASWWNVTGYIITLKKWSGVSNLEWSYFYFKRIKLIAILVTHAAHVLVVRMNWWTDVVFFPRGSSWLVYPLMESLWLWSDYVDLWNTFVGW